MKKLFQPLAKALSVCAILIGLSFFLLAPNASAQPIMGYNRGFAPYHPFQGGAFFPHNRFRKMGFFPHHRFHGAGLAHKGFHGAGLAHKGFHGAGLAHKGFHGAGLAHKRFHGAGLPYQRFHGAGFSPVNNFYLPKYKAKMQRMS